jgi:hypothetical protein
MFSETTWNQDPVVEWYFPHVLKGFFEMFPDEFSEMRYSHLKVHNTFSIFFLVEYFVKFVFQ